MLWLSLDSSKLHKSFPCLDLSWRWMSWLSSNHTTWPCCHGYECCDGICTLCAWADLFVGGNILRCVLRFEYYFVEIYSTMLILLEKLQLFGTLFYKIWIQREQKVINTSKKKMKTSRWSLSSLIVSMG